MSSLATFSKHFPHSRKVVLAVAFSSHSKKLQASRWVAMARAGQRPRWPAARPAENFVLMVLMSSS